MGKLVIREPLWRLMSIGVSEKRLADPDLVIEISYEIKGERVYPGKYKLNREKIGGYQRYTLKGIKLRLVPLVDLIKME